MKNDTLTGWPLIILSTVLVASWLAAGTMYAYRCSVQRPARGAASIDDQISAARLTQPVALSAAPPAASVPAGWNEVKVDGRTIGYHQRDAGPVSGVTGAGYSDMPVGTRYSPALRRAMSGAGYLR